MKKLGSTSDFICERDRELMAAFRNVLIESDGIALRDMFGMAARRPCSRFWVAERRCAEVISRMLRGDTLPDTPPQKRRMYEEILRRVTAWRRRNPGRPLSDAVFAAVNSPAPEFYLTDRSAREIIYRIRRNAKKRNA